MKPFQDITDPSVARALAHPLRPRILAELEDRTASPSQLAVELGVPLGVLSYHVRRLVALGFLKLVRRVPRRGAVEHYYTATNTPRISEQAWTDMPAAVKDAMLSAALTRLGAHIGAAAAAGGFEPAEAGLSRQHFRLDPEGWREAARVLEGCARQLEELERASEERRRSAGSTGDTGDGAIGATVVTMLFQAPAELAESPASPESPPAI